MGLERWLSQDSVCLTSMRTCVQSQHPPKKPGAMTNACNLSDSKMGGRDTLMPRAHWTACLPCLVKLRPLKDPAPNEKGKIPKEWYSRFPLASISTPRQLCTHNHIPRTWGMGTRANERHYEDTLHSVNMFTVNIMTLLVSMDFLRCTYTSQIHILVSWLKF